jgi:hypothetical protein
MNKIVFILLMEAAVFFGCSTDNTTSTQTPVDSKPIIEVVDPNFTWKNWYLSVPINNGRGSATSIYYINLAAANFTAAQSDYVWKNEDGSYSFKAKFTGYTTSGFSGLDAGKYCRSELREYWKGNQTTTDNWLMSTGTHILESKLKVDNIDSSSKQLYVAQIHGYDRNAPATIKVLWSKGSLYIEYYTKPPTGENWTSTYIQKPFIGKVEYEVFTIKLKVADGKFYYALVCENKTINTDYTMLYDYLTNGYDYYNYFKTGNYFRHNTDYTSTSQVTIYSINTLHE